MRKQVVAVVACAGILAGASSVDAGECVVNSNPVPPSDLAFALESEGSLPGQLSGVPFSVVSYEAVQIFWTGCGDDCLISSYPGETQCGDLVQTPIDSFAEREVAHLPNEPYALAQVSAEQSPTGKWNVFAQGFVHPTWPETGSSAAYIFELGTREVIDVTSSSASEMLPLEIGLLASSHMGLQYCRGNLFSWLPHHDLRFRVTEEASSFPFTRDLVDEVYEQFFARNVVFPVEVRPGATLIVDVWFRASANATPAQDVFGNYCSGAEAFLDFGEDPVSDGIQVFFTPDPALTLTPRSGFTYLPVPEPHAALGGLGAFAALAQRARRRST